MDEEGMIRHLAAQYQKRPELQALVNLLPGGGSLAALLQFYGETVISDRLRTFYEELATGDAILTEELINSEDFLHRYVCTLQAVARTRQRQKIRDIARFFRSATLREEIASNDDFEELLGVLDDVSYRELCMLILMEQFDAPSQTNQQAVASRSDFKHRLKRELGVREDEVDAALSRLERTGLFRGVSSLLDDEGNMAIEAGSVAGLGSLTPRYYRLRSLVIQAAGHPDHEEGPTDASGA